MTDIQEILVSLRDPGYAVFQARILPGVARESIIGVRVPLLRRQAALLSSNGGIGSFLEELPHAYYEENLLHAILICRERDFDRCIERIDAFLPYVDNWAVCDTIRPAVFARHHTALFPHVVRFLSSPEPFICRFGIETLMNHFLDDDFSPEQMLLPQTVVASHYYVDMAVAWYFATALAKQWDAAIPYFREHILRDGIRQKAIRKAIESNRLTKEQKCYLMSASSQKRS